MIENEVMEKEKSFFAWRLIIAPIVFIFSFLLSYFWKIPFGTNPFWSALIFPLCLISLMFLFDTFSKKESFIAPYLAGAIIPLFIAIIVTKILIIDIFCSIMIFGYFSCLIYEKKKEIYPYLMIDTLIISGAIFLIIILVPSP